MYELKFLFGILMDRSEIPRGPDVNRDVSRSRSQVIRSYWVHLWCSPSAGCNQSAGRLYKGWLQFPLLNKLCVFRESTPSAGSHKLDGYGFYSHRHLLVCSLWPFCDLCSANRWPLAFRFCFLGKCNGDQWVFLTSDFWRCVRLKFVAEL